MVIAPGEQRRAGRRAKRRRVELCVAHPILSQLIHGGRWNWSTKSTAGCKADIIRQDEQYVRRSFGGFDLGWKVTGGVSDSGTDMAFEGCCRQWKNLLRATDANCRQKDGHEHACYRTA